MERTERKLSGVMSDCGISMSNSASTLSIRLTMSSEVRPLSIRSADGAAALAPRRRSSMAVTIPAIRDLFEIINPSAIVAPKAANARPSWDNSPGASAFRTGICKRWAGTCATGALAPLAKVGRLTRHIAC